MDFLSNIEYMKELTNTPTLVDSAKVFFRYARESSPQPKHILLQDKILRRDIWAIYFCFNPEGNAHPQNIFMLERLRDEGIGILTIVASHHSKNISQPFLDLSDLVIWKDTAGFDISALKIGLRHLALHHEGSDVIWINDSVFGPFNEIKDFLHKCGSNYDVLGMTQSYAVRPHFQSYSFFLRKISSSTVDSLFPLTMNRCLDTHLSNVLVFETMMASNLVKARRRVFCWARPINRRYDLTMAYPYELIDAGFPFIKRSIVGKFADGFDQVRAADFFATMRFEHNIHET